MGNEFTAKLEGVPEMRAAFARLESAVRGPVLLAAARAGASPILNDAKSRSPRRTGTYVRSMHMETAEVSAERASVDLGSDLPYGRPLEMGSGLHSTGPNATKAKYKIAPIQDGGVLAFNWKNAPSGMKPNPKTGKFHFRFVMHPGIEARPHWLPALQGKKDEAVADAGAALAAAIYASVRGGGVR